MSYALLHLLHSVTSWRGGEILPVVQKWYEDNRYAYIREKNISIFYGKSKGELSALSLLGALSSTLKILHIVDTYLWN